MQARAAEPILHPPGNAGRDRGVLCFEHWGDTVTGATGTERAICSRSAYPSLFVGSLQSSSFIKTGGTSAQFLKADGSVDASTYLTSATLNLTSEDVTTALGFTPYNATNPDGFTSLIVGAASDQAMAGNTVTITSEQATAITNNTAKVSNVQSDWNAVDGLAVILNKPSISGSLAGVTNSDSDTPGGKTALGVGAGNAAETAALHGTQKSFRCFSQISKYFPRLRIND